MTPRRRKNKRINLNREAKEVQQFFRSISKYKDVVELVFHGRVLLYVIPIGKDGKPKVILPSWLENRLGSDL